jgi:hypothetical protein
MNARRAAQDDSFLERQTFLACSMIHRFFLTTIRPESRAIMGEWKQTCHDD